jgi:hypothetical protein
MNETYRRIDPVMTVMFKLEGLQLGNPQHHDRSEPWIEEFGQNTGRSWAKSLAAFGYTCS